MDATILAVRAVTSEYARQLLWPILGVIFLIFTAVMALIGWVAYVASPWWWFLAIGPVVLFIIAFIAWLFVYLLAKRWSPILNKRQKKATKKFVAHIGRVAEHMATPRFVIIVRVIKDVLTRPTSSRTFIGEIAQEPGEMRRDFDDLRSLF